MQRAPTKVLVVDDETDIADGLATYARAKGYEAMVAYDGLTAVELAEAQRPEVILLDIALPGLDGRDVLARLQRSGVARDAVVIFVTARDGQTDRITGLEMGAAEYETKPLHFNTLFQRIARLLEKKRRGEI